MKESERAIEAYEYAYKIYQEQGKKQSTKETNFGFDPDSDHSGGDENENENENETNSDIYCFKKMNNGDIILKVLLIHKGECKIWHPLLNDVYASNPSKIRLDRRHEFQEIEIKVWVDSLVPLYYQCEIYRV